MTIKGMNGENYSVTGQGQGTYNTVAGSLGLASFLGLNAGNVLGGWGNRNMGYPNAPIVECVSIPSVDDCFTSELGCFYTYAGRYVMRFAIMGNTELDGPGFPRSVLFL